MATVKRFEDLEVWALARNQCREIHALIKTGAYREDPDLRSQMNRASASVMDTISEGFERFSRADFRHFLVMAKASNGELRSQLHRMADRAFISPSHYQELVAANELLGKKLFHFIKHLTGTAYQDKSIQKPSGARAEEPHTNYGTCEAHDEYELPEHFINADKHLQLPTSNLQH